MTATQQLTETVQDNHTPLTANSRLTGSIFVSEGFGAVNILAFSNVPGTVEVIERVTCDAPSPTVPVVDGVRTQTITTTFDASTGRWFVATIVPITGRAIHVDFVNGAFGQAFFQMAAYLLPISAGGCSGGGGGTGDTGGPGATIATKSDVVVAAAIEQPVLFATDIPAGSKRVTIKNVGSNSARLKDAGAGGGASRGLQLNASESMSFGTSLGSLAPLDAFSTLGTTLAFFFERE